MSDEPTTPGIVELLDAYGIACIQAARKALALGLADNGPTDTYRAILAFVADLEAQRDEALKDAGRMEWLAEHAHIDTTHWLHDGRDPATTIHVLRGAIDAAIAQRGGKS